MASEQEMSGTSVNSDGDAESVSGSSGNELEERKRKENIRTGLPTSPFGKIVAVDEDVEVEAEGVGATKKQAAWEEDDTDEKGSGEQGEKGTWVEGYGTTGGEKVLTKDVLKKTEIEEEEREAGEEKRREREEEARRRNEVMERGMKEERWAEERMREIHEEEERAERVRAAAEEREAMEKWATFEAKRTGEKRETIDLQDTKLKWGVGLSDVEKTREKTREEETWREKREATARARAMAEKGTREKEAEKSKEAEGEGRKEVRMERGWGEEPKWHISGMTGAHSKREMWKLMLMPVERGGKDPKTRTGKIENKKVGKGMTI